MATQAPSTTEFLEPLQEADTRNEEDINKVLSLRHTNSASGAIQEAGAGNVQMAGEKSLEKPHPLRSPVSKRPPLQRAFTISSLPMMSLDENAPSPKNNRHMYKAPLKLKFSLSKSTAWRLEDDMEESSMSSYTDETPFGYTAGGLYFTNDHGTRPRRFLHRSQNGSHTDGELSKRSSSSEGSDLSINNKKSSGFIKLARKFSQRRERKGQPVVERIQGRSQSLENLPSPTSSTQSIDRQGTTKSPRLYRTLSLNQKPSPRSRYAALENRFSGTNKDFKEKKKRRKENIIDALVDAIAYQDVEEVKTILETEDVEVNRLNTEGFAPLDFAVMLGFYNIAKMLQAFGAQESPRLQSSFLEKHLRMLANEAEHKVEDLMVTVVHVTNSTASETKESERQLREWEWRRQIIRRMMNGLNNAGPPSKPGSVTLSVASEDSLLVRFTEAISDINIIITKYKIQWSRNEEFNPIEGEYVLNDLRSLEYTIPNLHKSVLYYVQVCCGNLKGFGPWLEATPPCAMPSSWHEVDDSKPRFQGRLVVIDDLFSRVWQSHEQFSPQQSNDSTRPMSNTFNNENGGDTTSPKTSRKEAVKKSISKYTNIFFHSAPKFVRNMKRGVYLAAVMYTSEDRVMVTLDENVPAIEVDDTYPPTFLQDFCWLMKVACTWKDVKKLKHEVEKNSSSTSVLFRCKLLNAVDALQSALGQQNLGQLHYKPVKDHNGSTVILVVNYLNHASMFRPRIMSLKWMSLNKLQKKQAYQPGLSSDLCYASDMLVTTIKEKVAYFQQSRKPLPRGMYIGYLKLRTFVDAIHVVVQEGFPNVLPHVKIRDNPNVSREEWQWLQSLDTLGERTYEPTKTAHEFQLLVARAAEKLMEEVGVSRDASKLHRIYDREVVELDENVSFLIVFPPPEDVCSAPGQVDTLTLKKKYISLSVQTFEMIHMCTYQRDFICHYSRLSSVLDMDSVLAQQALREAFSSGEVEKAKQRQVRLMEFQMELDETWKGMRWILDALHYARDRQVRGGIPLVEVFQFSQCDVTKSHNCNSGTDAGRHSNHKDGVIRVFTTCETGLPSGAEVTLCITLVTTASEIVDMVIRRLEKTCEERGKTFKKIPDESLKDFCLVAVVGSKEKCFRDEFKLLEFQNPWTRGKLFVRLRCSAMAATTFEQFTSV